MNPSGVIYAAFLRRDDNRDAIISSDQQQQ
jgi:hypothetical protein